MNAVPNELIRDTERLSESVTRPIPGSRKIHVEGSADVRVAMREIAHARGAARSLAIDCKNLTFLRHQHEPVDADRALPVAAVAGESAVPATTLTLKESEQALQGAGMAWLPLARVEKDLKTGQAP